MLIYVKYMQIIIKSIMDSGTSSKNNSIVKYANVHDKNKVKKNFNLHGNVIKTNDSKLLYPLRSK